MLNPQSCGQLKTKHNHGLGLCFLFSLHPIWTPHAPAAQCTAVPRWFLPGSTDCFSTLPALTLRATSLLPYHWSFLGSLFNNACNVSSGFLFCSAPAAPAGNVREDSDFMGIVCERFPCLSLQKVGHGPVFHHAVPERCLHKVTGCLLRKTSWHCACS